MTWKGWTKWLPYPSDEDLIDLLAGETNVSLSCIPSHVDEAESAV